MRMKYWMAACTLLVCASTAAAANWSHYDNERYAYSVDIPPGFSDVSEAENGDGGVSTSADGRAELSVWGSNILDRTYSEEIAWRVGQDKDEGWKIAYDRRLKTAASWSGSKGDRIFYQRSIPGCDQDAVYFNIEYDRSQAKTYDDIIKRLVKSLHTAC